MTLVHDHVDVHISMISDLRNMKYGHFIFQIAKKKHEQIFITFTFFETDSNCSFKSFDPYVITHVIRTTALISNCGSCDHGDGKIYGLSSVAHRPDLEG